MFCFWVYDLLGLVRIADFCFFEAIAKCGAVQATAIGVVEQILEVVVGCKDMRQYGLTRLVSGFDQLIKIPHEEYLLIKQAQNSLLGALFIEEAFDMLLENYFEYELTLLSVSTRDMLFRVIDPLRGHSDRRLVGRRIANLLSRSKSYMDQMLHHVREIYGGNSVQYKEVQDEKERQYDAGVQT